MRQNGTAMSLLAAVGAPSFQSDVYGFATQLQSLLHEDAKVNSDPCSKMRRITFWTAISANSIWHVSSSADQSK
jgi:hypothetical protein